LAKLGKLLVGSSLSSSREAIVQDGESLARMYTAAAAAAFWRREPDARGMDGVVLEEDDAHAAVEALRGLALLAPLQGERAQVAAFNIAALLLPFIADWPPHRISAAHWAASRLQLNMQTGALAPIHTAYHSLRLPFGVSHALLACVPRVFGTHHTGGSEEGRERGGSERDRLEAFVQEEEEALPITVDVLRAEIPFKSEQLVTREGVRVDERRETCWMADAGVGGV
jgi:hypothetical protein